MTKHGSVITQLGLLFFAATPSFAAQYLVKTKYNLSAQQTQRSFRNLQIVDSIPELNLLLVETTTSIQAQQSLNELKANSNVSYVEKNSSVYSLGENQPLSDDPLVPKQDWVSYLKLAEAWQITKGSRSNVVAIIDSGTSLEHPDLKNQLWNNSKDLPANGIDDDDNGYIDDVVGWNFVDDNNSPQDPQFHGTHVSGIIGAQGNNSVGMAGINWNISLMTLQALNKEGKGSLSAIIKSIAYAVKNGAKIINASWATRSYSPALYDAIQWATSHGVLVVAGAGNDRENIDHKPAYPAAFDFPGVVSVAAAKVPGLLASFTNFGNFSVDLAAPGFAIWSTAYDSWGTASGTSMAAPMVTGVAALILSMDPTLAMIDLRNAILNSVDPSGMYIKTSSTEGDINAAKAVKQFQMGSQIWPHSLSLARLSSYQFSTYPEKVSDWVWSSSNNKIAQVTSAGVIKAQDVDGVVYLSAKNSKGKKIKSGPIYVGRAPR